MSSLANNVSQAQRNQQYWGGGAIKQGLYVPEATPLFKKNKVNSHHYQP